MKKVCKNCKKRFEIVEDDLKFYKKVSPVLQKKTFLIPPPTLCPDCRTQRRMLWRNDHHLFKRRSNLSGKPILSFYPPRDLFVVYSYKEWWSKEWSALDYGDTFDFSRPFFEQFQELIKKTPLPGLNGQDNINSDFVNNAGRNTNCYLLDGANCNEDCYYGHFVNSCKNCVDNTDILNCEACYECIDCKDCKNLQYSRNCNECSDSQFLFNCKNCKHCFGSVNLTDDEYVFMNKKLSPQKYKAKLQNLELHKYSQVKKTKIITEKTSPKISL